MQFYFSILTRVSRSYFSTRAECSVSRVSIGPGVSYFAGFACLSMTREISRCSEISLLVRRSCVVQEITEKTFNSFEQLPPIANERKTGPDAFECHDRRVWHVTNRLFPTYPRDYSRRSKFPGSFRLWSSPFSLLACSTYSLSRVIS